MRVPASAALAMLLALGACSDSKPPEETASSRFNPFATDASSSTKGPPPPATLSIGDCFDTDAFAPGSSIDRTQVHLVSCTDPHQHEVYAIEGGSSLPSDAFPGAAAMSAFADDACLAAFEPALGVDYRESTLDFATITPDAITWKAGDRAVICVVHNADFATLTGSQLTTTTTSTTPTSTTSTSLAPEGG